MSSCRLPGERAQARTRRRKGIRGAHVGDTAPENVSTTGRSAQESDVVDTLKSAPENRRCSELGTTPHTRALGAGGPRRGARRYVRNLGRSLQGLASPNLGQVHSSQADERVPI